MIKAPIPKKEAIKIVRKRSREISEQALHNKSASIIERFTNSDDFIYANKIFLYFSSLPEIVNTKKLIDFAQGCGKEIFLPKPEPSKNLRRFQFTSFDELIKDSDDFYIPRIGIEEDLSDIDLIIIPCLAVSLFGQIASHGKINYNLILRNNFAIKHTLAFEFQIFQRIERERRDIVIDKITTERRIINTGENSIRIFNE